MNQSFAEFLTEQKADAAKIQEAAVLYIGEASGDLPTEKMRAKVIAKAGSAALVGQALSELGRDPALTEKILLLALAQAWEQPAEQERIRTAFAAARRKLAFIDPEGLLILTLFAMSWCGYFVHLAATGGETKKIKSVKRHPDGSFEEYEETEIAAPPNPGSTVSEIFKVLAKDEKKKE